MNEEFHLGQINQVLSSDSSILMAGPLREFSSCFLACLRPARVWGQINFMKVVSTWTLAAVTNVIII